MRFVAVITKILVLKWLFFPNVLLAQINESDTLRFKSNLSLTGFGQTGNVETIIFRAVSNISFIPFENWVYKTTNSYVYQEFGKVKADEDILSLNFLYFNPTRKVYPLALGFVSTNFRREIELRTLVGLGMSFEIFSKDKNWLKCSISAEHEHTDFRRAFFNYTEYNKSNIINTFRGTLWVSGNYHLLKNKLILTHQSYIQPSLENKNNYRWQADLGIELPLWKHLNLKANYTNTFESVIMANQKQQDQFLTFGFTVKNY